MNSIRTIILQPVPVLVVTPVTAEIIKLEKAEDVPTVKKIDTFRRLHFNKKYSDLSASNLYFC
jgi:hypothetical protein